MYGGYNFFAVLSTLSQDLWWSQYSLLLGDRHKQLAISNTLWHLTGEYSLPPICEEVASAPQSSRNA